VEFTRRTYRGAPGAIGAPEAIGSTEEGDFVVKYGVPS